MKYLIAVCLCGLCVLGAQEAAPAAGISANLVPAEIYPGDIFRLEVIRSDEAFAEFELEIPRYQHLHLLGTEVSPVKLEDGRYVQQESWIFQADTSGEIILDGVTAKLITGSTPQTVTLPPMKLSVVPYPNQDQDPTPMRWADPVQEKSSGMPGIYLLITALTIGAVTAFLLMRKAKREPAGEFIGTSLWEDTISDLENGVLNPDSLHLLYERFGSSLSGKLQLDIELAIYANRGDPGRLAESLRKEVPQ